MIELNEVARHTNELIRRAQEHEERIDFSKKLDRIIELLERLVAVEQRLQSDVCPMCFGDKYSLHNDGLMHPCPACEGTGKRI